MAKAIRIVRTTHSHWDYSSPKCHQRESLLLQLLHCAPYSSWTLPLCSKVTRRWIGSYLIGGRGLGVFFFFVDGGSMLVLVLGAAVLV